MKVLVIFFFCVISLFGTEPLQNDSLLLSLFSEKMKEKGEVIASYEQTKEMKALTASLHSSGIFHFISDSLLIWKQITPFPETYEMYPDGTLIITDEDGEVSRDSNEKIVERINRTMDLFYSGDISSMERIFDLKLQNSDSSIIMKVIPKRSGMKRAFTDITLMADTAGFVYAMELNSPHGTTTILFTEITDEQ